MAVFDTQTVLAIPVVPSERKAKEVKRETPRIYRAPARKLSFPLVSNKMISSPPMCGDRD
jgi:hypothetical protein